MDAYYQFTSSLVHQLLPLIEQRPLIRVEVAENYARAFGDAEERVFGHIDRDAEEALEKFREVMQLRRAAREDDTLLHDVGHELRGGLVKDVLDRLRELQEERLQGLGEAVGGKDDVVRQSGRKVAAADLAFQLVLGRKRRADLDLYRLRGLLADREARSEEHTS